jgi:nucleotide-binding universal stress UspA family protein
MSKILFATDFSDGSAAAERVTIDLARKLGASITVFHAYQLPAYMYPPGYVYAPTPDMIEGLTAGVRQALHDTAERIRAAGVPVGSLSTEGAPHVEIVRTADEGHYDLVALGTHGRTGLKHMWLGSVAEKVVRSCRTPVLTVRGETKSKAG